MENRFCGIALGGILENIRPLDDARRMTVYAIEETLCGSLPYHVLRDDGAPAESFCLLILGRIEKEIHFATVDGPSRFGEEGRAVPIGAIRKAVEAMPDGSGATGQMRAVLASPYAAAGILMIALTAEGGVNCAFARNPKLAHDDAARLLKSYFGETVRAWTGKN